jgi:hypothetical protein
VKFGPEGFKFQTAADRHCERSKAIQLSFLLPGGLLRFDGNTRPLVIDGHADGVGSEAGPQMARRPYLMAFSIKLPITRRSAVHGPRGA